jgi:hypothetical protein
MRSLNSSSFIFPNVRMRSSLAGRLSLTWSCSVDLQGISKRETKMKNIENEKQTIKIQTKTNLPVDIIHDIKEDGNTVSRVDNNAVHGDVSIFVHGVVFINVFKPSCQAMILLPNKKHLANKLREVGIFLEHEIKLITRLLP